MIADDQHIPGPPDFPESADLPSPITDEDSEDAIRTDEGFGSLTATKQRAIIGLLNQATVGKAAAAAGVGERSLHRWLDDPHFRRAYHKARREAFSQAISLTQRYAPLAVNTLAKVMADTSAPHHARVTAAATLLKFGREGIELDDLASRVEALEQATASGHTGARGWPQPTNS